MSKKLQPVQIDADTVIYVETIEDVEVPTMMPESEEQTRSGHKGWLDRPSAQVAQNFKTIESTIRTYTKYTLNAFRDHALTNVEKVTLEFGVNVSGEGGGGLQSADHSGVRFSWTAALSSTGDAGGNPSAGSGSIALPIYPAH
jgi:hypothetical protein